MKIECFRMGDLVQDTSTNDYGFVVGISQNMVKEAILKVQWQDNPNPRLIHPANVRKITPPKVDRLF
jgi:hypothetical protein